MIKFENVGLRYDLNAEILHDVSFTVAPQSFQFLSGPSGAGKTSLLKLMSLSLRPTRGLIHIFGQDVARLSVEKKPALRRDISVVFQDFRLLEHLTTYENAAIPFKLRGIEEASYRSEVVELLSWVGLKDRLHVYPSVLSGGEKQRAAIARAIITKPKLLLADEPTGNVDAPLAKRLLHLFVELNKFGTAVVLATHDLGLMEQLSTRCLIISDKKVITYE